MSAYAIEPEAMFDPDRMPKPVIGEALRNTEMTFDPQCMPEEPREIAWASSCPSEPADRPIRSIRDFALSQKLLSLPRFKSMDILDLIRLAEDEGKCRVSDRISAIAVLVGNEPLDSPKMQLPLVVTLEPGLPKYL